MKPTVLIIDDELSIRESLAANLEREGYLLLLAENGKEGLALLQETPPTVVILDLKMPVMDGYEFLRQLDPKPDAPYSVIVLTGHGNDEAVRDCFHAGVTFFLQKPYNIYELRGLVRSAVRLRQLTNELDELVKEKSRDLQQRVTEITALNRYYQEQSGELSQLNDRYQQALQQRDHILREIAQLAKIVTPFLLPNLGEIVDDQGAT